MDTRTFTHHPPLPTSPLLGDEGAANHTRLARSHDAPGVEIFTFGVAAIDPMAPAPARFPARQTREASALIAHNHGLDPARTLLVQQHPDVIDAGVFHNDVIAVGNERVLLIHQDAWLDQERALDQLDAMLDGQLLPIVVPRDRVSVADAVRSYLFNSQLVTRPDGGMTLIAAQECQQHAPVAAYIDQMIASAKNPVDEVRFFDLTQSMRNGGGPACLRLRVLLDEDELAAVNPGCLFTEALHDRLISWVERHYRDTLEPDALADIRLYHESQAALLELCSLLNLDPSLYASNI